MARNFGTVTDIGLPPQSTGPRILNSLHISVTLNTIGGTLAVGYDIVGQSSGATGIIEAINGDDVLVTLEPTSPSQSFSNAETVNINNAAFTAVVSSSTDVYVNVTTVADGENPHVHQSVSGSGAAHVRYSEGEQQMDAFGITRVTQRNLLEAFKFQYSENVQSLEDMVIGTASATHLPNESSVLLSTGTGATDSIIRSGEHWYPYIPGIGREIVQTLAVGDAGKANNVRRWGLFDDDNGVFFELDGTTLYAVVRSNTTGTPVETKVAQANWTSDVLDGLGGANNRSRVNLDVTNFNIYWIDYAWLGTGRVRFGIYAPSGERLLCHTVENANTRSTVYMTTGSLPIRWENTNTGVTAGNSSIKVACASVLDNAQQQVPEYANTHAYARTNVSVTGETVLFNIRTATTFNGITNRIISHGVTGSSASETAPVLVRIYENATIGGTPSWAPAHADSPLQIDTDGTTSGGELVAAFMVGVNETDTSDLKFLKIHTSVDGTTSKLYSVTAESLGAGTDVSSTFIWSDRG